MSEFTQLIPASGYNVENMVFSTPVDQKIDNKLLAKRVFISTKNPDGTIGELCMTSKDFRYCFGLNVNVDDKNKDIVTGYTMPICVTNKDGETQDDRDYIDTFNRIIEKCKDHIISIKDDLEQYSLERSDLKKICNCLYYKRDPKNKAKIMEGVGPTLYVKLMLKKGKIISTFFNSQTGEEINPLELIDKHCHTKAVIKFESIFIGNKISLQIKLYDCEIKFVNSGLKKLLPRPTPTSSNVKVVKDSNFNPLHDDDDDDDGGIDIDDAGSLKDEEPKQEIEEQMSTLQVEVKDEEVVVKPKKKIVKVVKK